MDILKSIRNRLISDTNITDLVGQRIFVHSIKKTSSNSYIVLKETLGKSEIVLRATRGLFTIQIYVKDFIEGGAYKKVKEISKAVLGVLNRKNESLTDGDTNIRLFVKSSGEPIHNPEENYWMMVQVYDFVTEE